MYFKITALTEKGKEETNKILNNKKFGSMQSVHVLEEEPLVIKWTFRLLKHHKKERLSRHLDSFTDIIKNEYIDAKCIEGKDFIIEVK